MKHVCKIIRYGVLLALATAVSASAALINVGDHFTVTGTIDTTKATIGYVNHGNGGPVSSHVYSGLISVLLNNTVTAAELRIGTFCTDVGAGWNSGVPYTAQVFGSPLGVRPAWANLKAIQNASYLYNTFYVPSWNPVNSTTTLSQHQAAGMQLAIWEMLYDTQLDGSVALSFGGGKFIASSFPVSTMTQANAYVNLVNAARINSSFVVYNDVWLKPDNNDSQGLIAAPVPEPTTLLAGALLLLPFAAGISRSFRRKTT